jgi:hypothetical protein
MVKFIKGPKGLTEKTHIGRRESHVKMEAETGVVQL